MTHDGEDFVLFHSLWQLNASQTQTLEGLIELTQSTPFMKSMTWTLQYKKEGVAGQGSLGCPKIEST